MTWVRKKSPAHDCVKPNPVDADAGTGSIWKCDECGQRWYLRSRVGDMSWSWMRVGWLGA